MAEENKIFSRLTFPTLSSGTIDLLGVVADADDMVVLFF